MHDIAMPRFGKIQPSNPARVAFGLSVRQIKFLDSIIQLCENGNAEAANLLTRSMFETTLATQFVTRPSWQHRVGERFARKHNLTKRIFRPTSDQRADIYVCFLEHQRETHARKIRSQKGLVRIGDLIGKSFDANILTQLKNRVGSDWETIQRESGSYCGLSIKDMAKKCGFAAYHAAVYHLHSDNVHSVDLDSYVEINEQGDWNALWSSPAKKVDGSLHVACMVFGVHFAIVSKNLGLGGAVPMLLSSFATELAEIQPVD